MMRRAPVVLEGSPARTYRDNDVQVSLGSRRLENEELEGNTVPGVRLQNRFSPLGEALIVREPAVHPMTDDAEEELPHQRRRQPTRRLVLVLLSTGTSQERVASPVPIGPHRDEEVDGSDTVSLFSQADSGFRASGDDEFGELPAMAEVPPVRPSVAVMRRGFVALDDWDLEEVFSCRGSLMILVGSFRVATKLVLDEIVQGNEVGTSCNKRG